MKISSSQKIKMRKCIFEAEENRNPFKCYARKKMRKMTNKYKHVGNVEVNNSEYMEVLKR